MDTGKNVSMDIRVDGYLNIFFDPWEFSDLSKWQLPTYERR